ncbi:MAG TPA: hypothetical protein VFM19_06905 [Candidatus Limnocylindria bacterium]|nr:hypothetical protein [Candidatus Limnocylindria bacterium]
MRRIPAILALLVAALLLPAAPARAADYELSTAATYTVLPDEERVDVTVLATFVNTTPNPTGQFSVFDEIKVAVQDGAAELAARDGEGALEATLARENDVNVATITLREGLRFEEKVNLTITYRLPDGGAEGLRVRPSAVVFPAWAFGTKSSVTVTVPRGFEVSTDGDPLTAAPSAEGITLTSGAVADPTRWLSLVIASGEAVYETTTRSVPLEGGAVDLQVRAFADDPEWGAATADLLADALPALQEALGLEYTRQGPVVVTEVVDIGPGGDIGEGGSTSPELVIGFDQAPFTIVHQAAHLWITDQVATDRWIREGLASWAAGRVAASLEVAPPYDAVARTAELADVAFPLESWGVGSATDEQDAFGYAASWSLTVELATAIGPEALATALRRIVAGRSAYDRLAAEEPAPGAVPVRPVDSRRLLDHLEAVSDVDLAPIFAERVFAAGTADELAARAAARAAYQDLLEAAGDWGAPATVTEPLAAWSFPAAEAAIEDARAWLVERDALVARIGEAGLTTPARLRDRYVQFGGGSEADAELAAEGAVVGAYQAALDASVAERGLIERIGLLAGPDPAAILQRANGAFAEGDLETALEEAQRAQALLDGAQTAGMVRLLSAGVVLLVGLAAAIWLIRRRRTLPSRHAD